MNEHDETEQSKQVGDETLENNVHGTSANKSASTSSGSLAGMRLGDYQVLRKLGRGGMADVYAARHLTLGREVAIKVLRSDFSRDKDYISRFRREARAAAKLNHSNIVQVYDVGSADSHHYIAQELIDGKNLREYLSGCGSLTSEEGIKVLLCVGAALEAASEVGITHRDIKPENIMRSSRGDYKVADFGLARVGVDAEASSGNLTQAGLTLGTPRYMSPEQVQGKQVDVRSDLYSLGVTMYHLLSGRPPFEADDPIALAVMHLHETPVPLDRARGKNDLPEWLLAVVSRLMNKLPTDRFQTPTELLDAVRGKESETSASTIDAAGTAAATIRLQRVADAVLHRRQRMAMRIAGSILCIAAATGAGAWLAHATSNPSVDRMLRPEHVAVAESIEQQYLTAVTRDDVAGWEAVGLYFPPTESSVNQVYYIKSLIQLARLHVEQERYSEGDQVLDQLLADPKTALKYRTIAWAMKCRALKGMNRPDAFSDARRKLKASYDELQSKDPAAIDLFRRVIPEPERLQLQLGNGTEGDES